MMPFVLLSLLFVAVVSGRELTTTQSCNSSFTELDMFSYQFNLTLDSDSGTDCEAEEMEHIGMVLNERLLEWSESVQERGYVISITNDLCSPYEEDDERRRQKKQRKLYLSTYVYYYYYFSGLGRCRWCYSRDDYDWRSLRGSSEPRRLQVVEPPCGCQRLDFNTDGNGDPYPDGATPYLHKKEYLDSHGVQIVAKLPDLNNSSLGYIPYNRPRLYDTSFHATDNHMGDPDLGSPNEDCGGPGVGKQGAPTLLLSDGVTRVDNPGANCVPQGNVLIVQESDKEFADDNRKGGTIIFYFRKHGHTPVTLHQVGLMDIEGKKKAKLVVTTLSDDETTKENHIYNIDGMGDNSLQNVTIGLSRVSKLRVVFKRSGAIRFLTFCHNISCAGEEEEEEMVIEQEEDPPLIAKDIPEWEGDMVDFLEDDATNALNMALDEFRLYDETSCLYGSDMEADLEMVVFEAASPGNDEISPCV